MEARPARVETPAASPDMGILDLAAALLGLQAALGLVSAVGVAFLLALTGGSPLYVVTLGIALFGPVLALRLAIGLTRPRRWARRGAVAFEALVLLNAAARAFFDRELALGLVVTLSSVVVPLVVCGLALHPVARRATAPGPARRKRRQGRRRFLLVGGRRPHGAVVGA